MKRNMIKLAGFSLLELMIATVLGAILLLTAGTLFMTFMIGNASTNARRQMSAEGTQMLGTLEYHIRNAKNAVCTNGNTILTLTKLDGTTAQACFAGNKLNFNRAGACGTNALNTEYVTTGNSSFACLTNPNGKQTVTVTFRLTVQDGSAIFTDFSRIIQLRNS